MSATNDTMSETEIATVNIKGPPVGYVDILEEATETAIADGKAFNAQSSSSPIRPSSAGKCTRELYYELMEFQGKAKYNKLPMAAKEHRIFNLGYSVENHILKHFTDYVKLYNVKYRQQVVGIQQIKNKDGTLNQWLEGSIDLCFWSEKWKCVADIKSKKDKFSASYASQWDELSNKLSTMQTVSKISDSAFWVEDLEPFLSELNDPFFESNFLQVNLYLHSKFLQERGADHGAIIQYNKNDSRLREIRFNPSLATYDRTLRKFETALDAANESNPDMAPRDYSLGAVKCAFCKFKGECWEQDDAMKSFFRTLKKFWAKDVENLGELGSALESKFSDYSEYLTAANRAKTMESEILKLMLDGNVRKIRLTNKEIWEAKKFKHTIALKRGKN